MTSLYIYHKLRPYVQEEMKLIPALMTENDCLNGDTQGRD
jgi:hypothetical protein